MGEITNVSIAVEIDGKSYAVVLPLERKQMLMKMAEALSDNSHLNVVPLGPEYKLVTVTAKGGA